MTDNRGNIRDDDDENIRDGGSGNIRDGNENIESDAEFFLRFLNNSRQTANNIISHNDITNNSNNADALHSIINELNELNRNYSIMRPSNITERNAATQLNQIINNPMSELITDPSVNTIFSSSMFGFPSSSIYRESPNLTRIMQETLMDSRQNRYKNVLSKDGEEEIKTVTFQKDKFPNESCPMTLNDFKEGDSLSQLPCGHVFESEAIMKWLKNEKASCPICRKALKSKEVKKKIKLRAPNSNINRINRRISRPSSNRSILLNLF